MKSFKTSFLGVIVLFISLSSAQAYVVKLGDSSTCAFQCAEKITCAKGFTNHFETACLGNTTSCSKTAEATCGKGLKWVHQGVMDVNLDIAEVSDSSGNKFLGAEAEKELNSLSYGIPAEGK